MTISDRKVLLVANTGGHLEQLKLLEPRLPFDGRRVWITSDTAQSRSLLDGEDVEFVSDVGSRDYASLLRNVRPAARVVRPRSVEAVVSTGSGQALGYLPLAAGRRISTHYIESATRTHGPSFTGKVLQRVPGIHLYTQHPGWASERWTYPGSVFDGYSLADTSNDVEISNTPITRAVVSLGTTKWSFRRLVERLVDIIPGSVDVLWQVGLTDISDLGIEGRVQVPPPEMEAAIRQADVLVSHAGTGIALTAFRSGRSPVLVPREFAHGEHIDDHQSFTADLLGESGLAVSRRVEQLTFEDFGLSAAKRVEFAPHKCAPLGLHI